MKSFFSCQICPTIYIILLFSFISPHLLLANETEVVVKIYTVFNRHNYHEPWQMQGQESRQGSGVIIQDNKILTNAHVVSDETFIQVRKTGHVKRYTAKVDVVAHEIDLALLSVKDKNFFKDISPLIPGLLAKIKDEVFVYGFPIGGDKLSITRGVVSRIEHKKYRHSNAYLMTCQIDASVNKGNSGGPVTKDGKLVGISLQAAIGTQIENIGYIVPITVLEQFLKDMSDGEYNGVPDIGISLQRMENPDLRNKYQMAKEETGVLVVSVYPGSPAEGFIKPEDVLLSVCGKNIENDGTIEFRSGERTYLGYLYQLRQINDTVDFTVLRNGNKVKMQLTLSKPIHSFRLVPHQLYDVAPEFYIMGGLVFQPLTLNYLQEYGTEESFSYHAPGELLNLYLNGEQSIGQREVVILTKVLADDVNIGYHGFVNGIIDKVNHNKIKHMGDLISAFHDKSNGEYHIIEDIRGYKIILDRVNAKQSNNNILKKYKINTD